MVSISESGLSVSGNGYTSKQQSIVDTLTSVISQEGISLDINRSIENFPALEIISLDVEHDESGGFVGCGLYNGNGIVYYFSDLSLLRSLPFHNYKIVAHNGVTDLEELRIWGINVRDEQLIWDSMLIGHLLDSSLKSYGLKDMAKRELGISYPSYDEIVGKRGLKAERITLDKQPIELVAAYNALDTYCTYMLYLKQKKAIAPNDHI
jgi:DNA polymerase I-like protein with 3'-5' exonuclease and polymerase domains